MPPSSAYLPPGLGSASADRARAQLAVHRLRFGTAGVLLEQTKVEMSRLAAASGQTIAARIAVHELSPPPSPIAHAPSASPPPPQPAAAAPETQEPRRRRPQSPPTPLPSPNLDSSPPRPLGSLSAAASASVPASKLGRSTSSSPTTAASRSSGTSGSGRADGSAAAIKSPKKRPADVLNSFGFGDSSSPSSSSSRAAPSSKSPPLVKKQIPLDIMKKEKQQMPLAKQSQSMPASSTVATSAGASKNALAAAADAATARSSAEASRDRNGNRRPKQPRVQAHHESECRLLRCPRELGRLGALLVAGLREHLPELPFVERGTGAGISEHALAQRAKDLARDMSPMCDLYPAYRPVQVALNALARMPRKSKRLVYIAQFFNNVFVLQQESLVPHVAAWVAAAASAKLAAAAAAVVRSAPAPTRVVSLLARPAAATAAAASALEPGTVCGYCNVVAELDPTGQMPSLQHRAVECPALKDPRNLAARIEPYLAIIHERPLASFCAGGAGVSDSDLYSRASGLSGYIQDYTDLFPESQVAVAGLKELLRLEQLELLEQRKPKPKNRVAWLGPLLDELRTDTD
ncbi:hypothetical protein H9P43_002447 [Blastocladiella emersonii ATCC 22665]|nr:hypothetical protein H9P43_002447 [Blastocladiella emersonii ATCC 22665]